MCPAFPRGASGGNCSAARCQPRHRRYPPKRAKDQRHDQSGQGHIAQGVFIARRQPQIGFNRARTCGARGHAGAVGIPNGYRGWIGAANRLRIAQRGNRLAGQTCIKAHQRVGAGRFVKSAGAVNSGPDQRDDDTNQDKPCRLQRQIVLHTHGPGGYGRDGCRPKGPERTRNAFGPEADQSQTKRGFNPL